MKLNFRILKVIIPVTALTLFITGCTSDGFTLGGKYLDSNIRTAIIDTCSMKMTTMVIDSVQTSGNSIGLVGQYFDPNWGHVKATTYATYTIPSRKEYEYDVYYDSVALLMTLSGTYYGDTTLNQTVSVYRLNNEVELTSTNTFYSNDSVPYDRLTGKLGEKTFRPRPFTVYNEFGINASPKHTNKFSIKLNDSFGSDLFNVILAGGEKLNSSSKWYEYFPGIAIAAEGGKDENNAIFGFKMSTDTLLAIRLYYHYSTFTKGKGTIDIPIDESLNFYGIVTDRNVTGEETFKDLNLAPKAARELPTTSTKNMALVQALSATYVKIEFPYINDLLEMGDYGAIVDAVLLIYPVAGTYSDTIPLPEALSMYISNENNVSLDAITNYSGESLQTGNLVRDEMNEKNTYYSYDITSFLNSQLGAVGINKRNLQLICPQDSLSQTLNTLTFGDQKLAKDKTRLIVKYLIYENN